MGQIRRLCKLLISSSPPIENESYKTFVSNIPDQIIKPVMKYLTISVDVKRCHVTSLLFMDINIYVLLGLR